MLKVRMNCQSKCPALIVGIAAMVGGQANAQTTQLPHFPPNGVWHRDISTAPLKSNSASIISHMSAIGGWGNGNQFQIDFSIHVADATAASPTQPVLGYSYGGYYTGECDDPGSSFLFPVPAGGGIEGTDPASYSCANDPNGEDCHLLVQRGTTLFESYKSNLLANSLDSQCALRWDLTKVYPPEGRGQVCTTADAAGFPIAPLLFNAQEVSDARPSAGGRGYLDHAIRFIMPNTRMKTGVFVHPATHGTSATSDTNVNALPYGSRLRLHSGSAFDLSHYNEAAQVILRTMQHYGIVLADGGNIALTGEDDTDTGITGATWAGLGIDSKVFNSGAGHGNPPVQVTDFDVIETGPEYSINGNCVRTPDDFIYIDHFDY